MSLSQQISKNLENGQPLFISEVAHFIQTDFVGNKVKELLETEDYVREHAHFDSIETVREVRAILQSRPKLFTALEVAQIGSLLPKTSEEAMALIPSLRDKDEFQSSNLLQDILDEVLSHRKMGASYSSYM